MRILMVHNYYQQAGGEDVIFEAEQQLLASRGHDVQALSFDNKVISDGSPLRLVRTSVETVWSGRAQERVRDAVQSFKPDVVHFYNTFPLISPAAYWACRREGVAVVKTVQNYRLLCPNAVFYRDGHVCEDCQGRRVKWPGVVHACYRSSRPASATVAAMLLAHRLIGTWSKAVTTFVTPTEFTRQKLLTEGIPESSVAVKPNFVAPDPGVGSHAGQYALFVGRLTQEKGIPTLLRAWDELHSTIPLKIAGDGPLRHLVEAQQKARTGIEWLGRRTHDETIEIMRDASMLIFPSEWYEGMPMTILEAYAAGTPVIASDVGNVSEIARDGRGSRTFRSGNADDLVTVVQRVMGDSDDLAQLRLGARREYEDNYTADQNYQLLLDIYNQAIADAASRA